MEVALKEHKEPLQHDPHFVDDFARISLAATFGCTSKNYVKQQTTPLINKTNELDDLTAKNSRDIKDVDARAQAGIAAVNAKTAEVDQKAQTAGQNASSAQQTADAANGRVSVLTNTVANLDNYRPVAETSVKFGFNKDNLTQNRNNLWTRSRAISPIPRVTSSPWKAEQIRWDRQTITTI